MHFYYYYELCVVWYILLFYCNVIMIYVVLWNGRNEATIDRLVNLLRSLFFLFFYCNMQEQTNNDDDDDDDSSLKHFNPLFVHKTKMRTTKSLLESYLSLVDGENFLKMGWCIKFAILLRYSCHVLHCLSSCDSDNQIGGGDISCLAFCISLRTGRSFGMHESVINMNELQTNGKLRESNRLKMLAFILFQKYPILRKFDT